MPRRPLRAIPVMLSMSIVTLGLVAPAAAQPAPTVPAGGVAPGAVAVPARPAAAPAARDRLRLAVSTNRPTAGHTIRVRVTRATAPACVLRATPSGRERPTVRTRAAVTRAGKATWSFDTTGRRTGAWRLEAVCGGERTARRIRIVAPRTEPVTPEAVLPAPPSPTGPSGPQQPTSTPPPAPPPLPFTAPTITTDPPLSPAYDPAIEDYVVRCTAGTPVSMAVATAEGTGVSVDGSAPIEGAATIDVNLAESQSFTIVAASRLESHQAHVRCLPSDLPTWSVEGEMSDASDWLAFAVSSFAGSFAPYVIVTDRRGTPVWWLKDPLGRAIDVSFDGASGLWYGSGWDSYRRVTFDGTTTAIMGPNLDQHDFVPFGDGHYLGIRYPRRDCVADPGDCADVAAAIPPTNTNPVTAVVDGEIVELDENGTVVKVWRTRDHLALAESQPWLDTGRAYGAQFPGTWDIVHLNSVEDDGAGGVIVSARHLDAVFRIDWASGDVTWKVGGVTTPVSLSVVGDTDTVAKVFDAQHDARLGTDGTLTVYDNGTYASRPPRLLRLAVAPDQGIATVLESVHDTRATGSFCCGGTRRLANGNWLTAWGGRDLISEVRPDDSPVFSLTLLGAGNPFAYRALPAAAGLIPGSALHAGMDAMHPR